MFKPRRKTRKQVQKVNVCAFLLLICVMATTVITAMLEFEVPFSLNTLSLSQIIEPVQALWSISRGQSQPPCLVLIKQLCIKQSQLPSLFNGPIYIPGWSEWHNSNYRLKYVWPFSMQARPPQLAPHFNMHSG